MVGETDLRALLAGMSPRLLADEYVFCSFPGSQYGDHRQLQPIATMVEEEGLSLVVPRARVDKAGLEYASVMRCIGLQIHSSLEAVGLTAAFASALADKGISANVVAGYHHDHIFVAAGDADRAITTLKALSKGS